MIDWILTWPTWQITRTLGIAAYLLLFTGMSLGLLYGYPFAKGSLKTTLYAWHSRLTGLGTILALLHAAVLVVDTYTPFTWTELLIPFMAHDKPLWYGLGTLALYGMLALLLTSDLRPTIKRSVWLAIHMLAYPIYVAALIHGVMAGTDSEHPLMQWVYITTLLTTLVLAAGRALIRSRATKGSSAAPTARTAPARKF